MKLVKQYRIVAMAIVFSFVAICTVSAEDEILESIEEAKEYYEEKNYIEAKSSLDYASQLLGQLRSENMQSFLPEPLEGWRAEKGDTKSAGAAFFGGMAGASKNYYNKDKQVTVEIMGDSPMIQGVMMMLTNPAYATADGGKLMKIKRQKAVLKYDPSSKRGDIQLAVANKYVVKVNGEGVEEQDLIDYAKGVNYKELKKF